VKLIDLYNIDNVCWESDYPHSDSSWPDGPEILEPLLSALSSHQSSNHREGDEQALEDETRAADERR